MDKKMVVSMVLLVVFVLAGCGMMSFEGEVMPPAEATAKIGQITSESLEPVADENTPVEEPPAEEIPEEDAPDVVYEGVSFSYDDTLASGVTAETVPAVTQAQPGEMMAPETIQVTFDGYILPDTFHTPRIAIYPVGELEAVNERAAVVIANLNHLLAEKPELTPDGGFEAPSLPFLPLWNAGQYLRTQIAYLDFENGTGVRYLTQFGQAMLPVNNQALFYTFQGLTDDGAYYIAAVLPVSHSILPADEMGLGFTGEEQEEFYATFDSYILDIAQQLGAQAADSFNPSLTLLDAMIQSLSVE